MSWDWFKPVTDTVASVGNWMETNPGAAAAIGGAATAGLQYMSAAEQREFDKRQAREERAWRENRSKASSGNSGYGSHTASLTKGLLSG